MKLLNNVYGQIKVIEYIGNRKYKCQCILCGNISEKFSTNLKGNLSCKVCGKGYKNDITGQTFGKLKVISFNKIEKKWLCVCECGKHIEVTAGNLKSGNTKSCGCAYIDHAHRNIIFGTRPQQLDVIYKNNKSGVRGVYYCKNRKKWRAEIMFQGKKYYLGSYDYIQDAIDIRKEAENELTRDFLEWYNNDFSKEGDKNDN